MINSVICALVNLVWILKTYLFLVKIEDWFDGNLYHAINLIYKFIYMWIDFIIKINIKMKFHIQINSVDFLPSSLLKLSLICHKFNLCQNNI